MRTLPRLTAAVRRDCAARRRGIDQFGANHPGAVRPVGSIRAADSVVSDATSGFNARTGTVTFFDGGTARHGQPDHQSVYLCRHELGSWRPYAYGKLFRRYPQLGLHKQHRHGSGDFTGATVEDVADDYIRDAARCRPGAAPFTLTASASSGLTVTYSTSSTACSLSGSQVTVISAGSCTIAADQSGNSTFSAASTVTQTFNITKPTQTITFNALPNVALGSGNVTLSATASSGLTVTFSTTSTACSVMGSIVTLLAAGPCVIAADQAGNGSFCGRDDRYPDVQHTGPGFRNDYSPARGDSIDVVQSDSGSCRRHVALSMDPHFGRASGRREPEFERDADRHTHRVGHV